MTTKRLSLLVRGTTLGLVLILMFSSSAQAQGTLAFQVARFTGAGQPDTTFGTGGISKILFSQSGFSVDFAVVDTAYKRTVVVGTRTNPSTGKASIAIWRLTSAGLLDTTFGSNGYVSRELAGTVSVRRAAILPSGRIIVVGASEGGFSVQCFTSSGGYCSFFPSNIITTFSGYTAEAHAVIPTSDGGFLVGGTARRSTSLGLDAQLALAKYVVGGQLDTTFSVDGKRLHNISSIAPYPIQNSEVIYGLDQEPATGKFVAAGTYISEQSGGAQRLFISRYKSDGGVDPSFAAGLATPFPSTEFQGGSMTVTADGGIAVAGVMNNRTTIVKVRPHGALDTTFGLNGTVSQDLSSLLEFPVGLTEFSTDLSAANSDLFVGAGVWPSSSGTFPGVVRYGAYGALDTTFGNAGVASPVSCFQYPISVGSGVHSFIHFDNGGHAVNEPRPVLVYACTRF